MNTAVACLFKQHSESEWEKGIAIVTNPGNWETIAIIPMYATTINDIIDPYDYLLKYTYGSMTPSFEKEGKG